MDGHGNVQEFKDFQKYTNQLIDMDIQWNTIKDADLNKKQMFVQQLFINVICNYVGFNS